MARYKAIDTSPRFLAVDLEKQLLPGSFEHAVRSFWAVGSKRLLAIGATLKLCFEWE